jgi:GNAT superfamily N-acetyltransferase
MKVIDIRRRAVALQQREISRVPDNAMRPGVRRVNDDASVRVTIPEAVPEHMRAKVRELTELYVAPAARRTKLATILMNFVCQEADANRMTLILTAKPEEEGAMDEAQLVAWYQRFGFQVLPREQGAPYLMARQVHEKPRIMPALVHQAVQSAIDAARSLN